MITDTPAFAVNLKKSYKDGDRNKEQLHAESVYLTVKPYWNKAVCTEMLLKENKGVWPMKYMNPQTV